MATNRYKKMWNSYETERMRMMSGENRKVTILEQFFSKEIGIEIKACLYFCCILAYYFIFRIIMGSWNASIIHMIEMIVATYVIGYIQLYLLSDFDEMDEFHWKVIVFSMICSGIYVLLAIFCNWFDGNIIANIVFFAFMMLCYICYFVICRAKRRIDTRLLNEELREFQMREIRK